MGNKPTQLDSCLISHEGLQQIQQDYSALLENDLFTTHDLCAYIKKHSISLKEQYKKYTQIYNDNLEAAKHRPKKSDFKSKDDWDEVVPWWNLIGL